MQLFYTPEITGDQYQLDEMESKHCVRVLRMRVGDQLHLVNGVGSLFKAEIIDANPKACVLNIIGSKEEYGKRDYMLHVAIAPTKNIERFEWFLEKTTEIGIDTITPLLCEHSERKQIKPERLEKIIVSAMKQSVKAYKPKLRDLTKFSDFVRQPELPENRFIAHCYDGAKEPLKKVVAPCEKTLILIGPEGDFSPKEIELAVENGFRPISMGKSRLRTETAGVVACHSIAFLNE